MPDTIEVTLSPEAAAELKKQKEMSEKHIGAFKQEESRKFEIYVKVDEHNNFVIPLRSTKYEDSCPFNIIYIGDYGPEGRKGNNSYKITIFDNTPQPPVLLEIPEGVILQRAIQILKKREQITLDEIQTYNAKIKNIEKEKEKSSETNLSIQGALGYLTKMTQN